MTGCTYIDPGHPDLPRLGFGVAARLYQERFGWAVLALERKQKRPHRLMRHGVLWASRDASMIEAVYGQDPYAGVGIPTGLVNALMVVDLDLHGGADGTASWAQFLAERRLSLPPGPWVQSPSGGQHHYYRLPPGLGMPSRPKILPAVDLKIDGGYVGAPPTVIGIPWSDGKRAGMVSVGYRWTGCPCQMPLAPDWLIDFALNAPGTGGAGGGGSPGDSGGGGGKLDDLTEVYATGLPVGERNTRLMQLACQQFARYGSADRFGMAITAIDRVLAETDPAGFYAAEQHRTITSARDFMAACEQEKARQDAADREAVASVPVQWGGTWIPQWHR